MLEAIELIGLPPSHPLGWLMGAYIFDARRSFLRLEQRAVRPSG
jgi:hypothetical protein